MANQFKEAAERKRREAEEKAKKEAEEKAAREAEEARKAAEAAAAEENNGQQTGANTPISALVGQHVGFHESKTAKLNILLKPSVKNRLMEESDKGMIKSANDVINVQLDKYFAVKDAVANGTVKTREELEKFVIREYLDK